MPDIFRLYPPKVRPLPVLANIPHSGLRVPESIRQILTPSHQTFLPHQDWHLDRLYDFLPELGITLLQATHSRYVIDLNRPLKEPYFGSFWRSPIPQKTAFDIPLYQQTPSDTAINQRIQDYYLPYHAQIEVQLNQLIKQFGHAYLLDLHSFHGPITDDVCLGNGNGASCSENLIHIVEQAFAAEGYRVVRNKVFTGGHITRHYGANPHVESLQIEVRYPVYLEAASLDLPTTPDWRGSQFDIAKQRFRQVFNEITANMGANHG